MHWLRFTLAAPPPDAQGRRTLVLELHPPYNDDLQLYLSHPGAPGQWDVRRAGDRLAVGAGDLAADAGGGALREHGCRGKSGDQAKRELGTAKGKRAIHHDLPRGEDMRGGGNADGARALRGLRVNIRLTR